LLVFAFQKALVPQAIRQSRRRAHVATTEMTAPEETLPALRVKAADITNVI
jgi:hypothetical protein